MCERSESAREVRDAARCLSAACHERTLRQLYSETVKEGVPQWAVDLLAKLK
jgi:hypothetical protein